MAQLNPQQQQAIRYLDGPLLVLAGAGSGKTSVITHKIAHLLEQGYSPHEIVAVTFTNKAAREMKQRVAQLLAGGNTKGLSISTFHLLGLRMLREHAPLCGYRANFSIFDADDALQLVRELMRKTASTDNGVADRVYAQISQWKNALVDPAAALARGDSDPIVAAAARAYGEYRQNLLAYNACDFDDLIAQPVALLRTHDAVRAKWQTRVRYLLVDEYQDTNAAQYELVKLLVGTRAALTVVGDDDQSIYAWRGAQPQNLKLLQDDFPDLRLIKLEQNYRSSGRILRAANTLIANNPHAFDKKLWSGLGYGDPLQVLRARNDEHEAEKVMSQLLHHKFVHRTAFRDYAILYRGNHQSRPFEKVLREHRVPYFLSGGNSFFDRSEIKDMMAYLRLLANPSDDAAFLRIVNTPRREIGAVTLEKLAARAQRLNLSLFDAIANDSEWQQGERGAAKLRAFATWLAEFLERVNAAEAPATAVGRLVDEIDYAQWLTDQAETPEVAQRRLDNVKDLFAWLEKLGRDEKSDFAELIAKLGIIGMLDREENDGDNVSLMTLHAAKGLEFEHVFMVGMEEGLLPHRSSIDADAIDEERRLAYVGITRAKKTLGFSYAAQRKRYGDLLDCEPSRFLQELPPDDLQWETNEAKSPDERAATGAAHLANLRGILK